jgi:hypothetical protein
VGRAQYLALGAVVAACAVAQAPVPPAGEPSAHRTPSARSATPKPPPPPTPTPTPTATASVSASASASTTVVVAAPKGDASPGRIGCGSNSCIAGKELCCTDVCIERRNGPIVVQMDGWHEWPDHERCEDAGRAGVVAYCDGAGDCPPKQACCDDGIDDGVCMPEKGGRQPCPRFERCRGGDICRTRGARCGDGKCVRGGQKVACGSTSCSGENAVCCASNEATVAASERHYCEEDQRPCTGNHARLECRTDFDCLPGDKCCALDDHTTCAHNCDSGTKACRTDSDCVGETMSGSHGTAILLDECKLAHALSKVVRRCQVRGFD